MAQESWIAGRLRVWVFAAGALAAFGVVGMALSALGAPMTLTWAAATGAGIAGGWAAVRLLRRDGTG